MSAELFDLMHIGFLLIHVEESTRIFSNTRSRSFRYFATNYYVEAVKISYKEVNASVKLEVITIIEMEVKKAEMKLHNIQQV